MFARVHPHPLTSFTAVVVATQPTKHRASSSAGFFLLTTPHTPNNGIPSSARTNERNTEERESGSPLTLGQCTCDGDDDGRLAASRFTRTHTPTSPTTATMSERRRLAAERLGERELPLSPRARRLHSLCFRSVLFDSLSCFFRSRSSRGEQERERCERERRCSSLSRVVFSIALERFAPIVVGFSEHCIMVMALRFFWNLLQCGAYGANVGITNCTHRRAVRGGCSSGRITWQAADDDDDGTR